MNYQQIVEVAALMNSNPSEEEFDTALSSLELEEQGLVMIAGNRSIHRVASATRRRVPQRMRNDLAAFGREPCELHRS